MNEDRKLTAFQGSLLEGLALGYVLVCSDSCSKRVDVSLFILVAVFLMTVVRWTCDALLERQIIGKKTVLILSIVYSLLSVLRLVPRTTISRLVCL